MAATFAVEAIDDLSLNEGMVFAVRFSKRL